MHKSHNRLAACALLFVLIGVIGSAQSSSPVQVLREIPKTFADREIAESEIPLVDRTFSPKQMPEQAYYALPIAPVYKTYPVYHPGKEPAGYLDWLKQQEPQIVFDASALKTDKDWIQAGELVFDKPIGYTPIGADPDRQDVRNPAWYEKTGMPLLKDGTVPFFRYVVREEGKIELGTLSCGSCHTRVMPDGSAIKGAQGNFPFDRAFAWTLRNLPDIPNGPDRLTQARTSERLLYEAPWIPSDGKRPAELSLDEILLLHESIPPGVMARHGTSTKFPAKVPDLIGVQERRYLDATGLVRHRNIGDLMRYAAFNQGADFSAQYGDFVPLSVLGKVLPPTVQPNRYSDEQLFALALYIYSLKPPENPNKFDAVAAQGQKVFEREGCGGCHTPPLYTNNKLTIAAGFTQPAQDIDRADVLSTSVGTDPGLALKTRRGTGYYKIPSLKGVWYRGPFEHNGSVVTLEDWFDPKRLRDDYAPTGFQGSGVKTRAVKGHEFGLRLSAADKRALIAFLKTL